MNRVWNAVSKKIEKGLNMNHTFNKEGQELRLAKWKLLCVLTNGLGLWEPPGGGVPLPQWLAFERLNSAKEQ